MKIYMATVALFASSVFGGTAAQASRTQMDAHSSWIQSAIQAPSDERRSVRSGRSASRSSANSEDRAERNTERSSERGSSGVGPRPSQWCGWWMRTQRGGGPEYNLAWNWTKYGSPGSAQVGAVVVWAHHVGEIVGQASNGQWIVRSGNDGGQVRTRARSIAGAVVRV